VRVTASLLSDSRSTKRYSKTRIATASNCCREYRAWVSGPLLPITF